MDLWEIPGEREPESSAPQGEKPWEQRNAREIQQGQVHADPYCAWQKGTNENLNGLLREFYPKGRNLSRVAPATLKRNLALINARPRKVLNFHSPQELWDFELNSCCT